MKSLSAILRISSKFGQDFYKVLVGEVEGFDYPAVSSQVIGESDCIHDKDWTDGQLLDNGDGFTAKLWQGSEKPLRELKLDYYEAEVLRRLLYTHDQLVSGYNKKAKFYVTTGGKDGVPIQEDKG